MCVDILTTYVMCRRVRCQLYWCVWYRSCSHAIGLDVTVVCVRFVFVIALRRPCLCCRKYSWFAAEWLRLCCQICCFSCVVLLLWQWNCLWFLLVNLKMFVPSFYPFLPEKWKKFCFRSLLLIIELLQMRFDDDFLFAIATSNTLLMVRIASNGNRGICSSLRSERVGLFGVG